MKQNKISLIIPTYKQQKTIVLNLSRIKSVMDQLRYDYEIIVVIDGYLDDTHKVVKRAKIPKVHILGYKENKGKGYAIRYGMKEAKGTILAFIDSGMDLDPNGLSMLLEHFEWYNADIIVGSKLHPVSKISYPFVRKVMSFGYRLLVKSLFGLSVRDTQVGLKFYKRKVLEDVLPRLQVNSFAFDIEILALANHLGYRRIYEAPVELNFTGISSITSHNFWRTILSMLYDTFVVFYRIKFTDYYAKKKDIR